MQHVVALRSRCFCSRSWLCGLALLLLGLLPLSSLQAAELALTFFDIGQGDAALIVSPTGKKVLIDGGPPEGTEALLAGLAARGVDKLDLILLSHPHLDHLGGLQKVVERLPVALFMDGGYPSSSPPYTALLKRLAAAAIPVKQATLGRTIELGDGAVLRLLGPPTPWITGSRSDVNANSVLLRVDWRGRTALFAADAEPDTEQWLLNQFRAEPKLLQAEVLKVGHHGSRFSSSAPFLAAVRPSWAVISVAAVNDYHHPTPEAMSRLTQAGAKLLRTDELGAITLRSRDGQPWQLSSERQAGSVASPSSLPIGPAARPTAPIAPPPSASPGGYVGSQRSPVFHRPDCSGAQKILPQNLQHWDSRAAALASGRRPAEDCHP